MADWLFSAGQALSVLGLAWGWYLSLSAVLVAEEVGESSAATPMLHHLRIA